MVNQLARVIADLQALLLLITLPNNWETMFVSLNNYALDGVVVKRYER